MRAQEHESSCEAAQALLEKNIPDIDVQSIDLISPPTLKPSRSRRRVPWLAVVLMGLNIAGLIMIYMLLANRLQIRAPLVLPADRLLPSPEYEIRVLQHQHLRPGPESDRQWQDDGPQGHGFIIIDEPDRFDLPLGMTGGGGRKRYGLTWAHQYHCLWMLRKEYWKFVSNDSTLIGKSLEDDDAEAAYMWHLAHCFDYIKQTIICNMDVTIEYPTNGGPRAINGYDIPHRCAKRAVYDQYMVDHAPDGDLSLNEIMGTPVTTDPRAV